MKRFESLTRRGKARRLRELAIHALDQYDLRVADVRLVGMHTNALYRVRTVRGQSYVVRVCTPGWRTATDLLSGVMWLRALYRDTDIGAPQPQQARNGDFLVRARAEGVPEPRLCIVLSWIPGAPLAASLTGVNLYKMGVLFARLHEHGAGFIPPNGFTRRKMDSVYARGEQVLLFSDSCRDAFTPHARDVFEGTRTKVYEAFERLYAQPKELRVIHNDLWHGNIKVYRGRLRPLDFEDTIWGHPVQDIAMALQDLMVDVARDAFEALQGAFRGGYESLGRWPESYDGQIDTFRAGRMLWVANYVARFERQHLREHINGLAGLFERFLETSTLRKS